MSRFVEILNQFHGEITIKNFHRILETMKQRLDAQAAHIEMTFPYFMPTQRDSGSFGIERYQCSMHGSLQESDDLVMTVNVPISLAESTTPWGNATVSVRFQRFIWLEDLITVIQETLTASAPINGVEEISQRLGKMLSDHAAISWFFVTVENRELNYDLFASVQLEPSTPHFPLHSSIQ